MSCVSCISRTSSKNCLYLRVISQSVYVIAPLREEVRFVKFLRCGQKACPIDCMWSDWNEWKADFGRVVQASAFAICLCKRLAQSPAGLGSRSVCETFPLLQLMKGKSVSVGALPGYALAGFT